MYLYVINIRMCMHVYRVYICVCSCVYAFVSVCVHDNSRLSLI